MVQPFIFPAEPVNYLGQARQINQQNALVQREQAMQDQEFQNKQQDRQTAATTAQRTLKQQALLSAARALSRVPAERRAELYQSQYIDDQDWVNAVGPDVAQQPLQNPRLFDDFYITATLNKDNELTDDQKNAQDAGHTRATASPVKVVTFGPDGRPVIQYRTPFDPAFTNGIPESQDANSLASTESQAAQRRLTASEGAANRQVQREGHAVTSAGQGSTSLVQVQNADGSIGFRAYNPRTQALGPLRAGGENTPPPKQIPMAVQVALSGNAQSRNVINTALALIKKTPGAIGLVKGLVPDASLNRSDPEGIPTRSAIANVSSQLIHERAGSAATASEMDRLKPFLPSGIDNAETATLKLKQLLAALDDMDAGIMDTYGIQRPGGGGPPGKPAPKGVITIRNDADFNRLPHRTRFRPPGAPADGSQDRIKP